MNKTKVTIGFRSGNSITIEVDEMRVVKDYNDLVQKISWTGGPRLLYMSLENIEYVIEVE